MNTIVLYFFAFVAGIMLSIQSGFNAQLGVLLKSLFLASFIAYAVSTLFALIYILSTTQSYYAKDDLVKVPFYLWIAGGFFSVVGISLYYILIPKIGIAKMFTFGLAGQMMFVMFAANLGWFNLPVDVFTYKKFIGLVLMLSGVALINLKEV
jgi:bacterial/archaeal transporter family-2 protein